MNETTMQQFQFPPPQGNPPPRRFHPGAYFNSRPSARGDRLNAQLTGGDISIHAPPRGATRRRRDRTAEQCNFNSRPSARGDPPFFALFLACLRYFNSRPSARGDPRGGVVRTANFNSRPSARGDDEEVSRKRRNQISIHAPPRGATLTQRKKIAGSSYFNSRPSARGDWTPRWTLARRWTHFNSRPSARGDMEALLLAVKYEMISIHAPPRGATGLHKPRRIKEIHFNSRPSARGDDRQATAFLINSISIHAPPRGATHPEHLHCAGRFDFNSRPSARGDVQGEDAEMDDLLFQFTPLREGRRYKRRKAMSEIISIHAPPRGATIHRLKAIANISISIHAPPRGATRI